MTSVTSHSLQLISSTVMFYPYSSHQTHLVSCFAAERTGSLGACGWILVILSGLLTIVLFPITIWFSLKVSDRNHADDRNHSFLGCCCVIQSNLAHPPSLLQIVQEYERTVIFRLGRITDRKAKGPGRHCLTQMVPCDYLSSPAFSRKFILQFISVYLLKCLSKHTEL